MEDGKGKSSQGCVRVLARDGGVDAMNGGGKGVAAWPEWPVVVSARCGKSLATRSG